MRIRPMGQLFLVVVVFLALLVGAGLLYQRERRAQAGLESQIGALAPILQKPAPGTALAQASLDSLQSRIGAAQAVFPGADPSIEVVRTLEKLASSWGVSIVRQTALPGWTTEGRFEFYLLNYDLTLEGPEQNLLNFVTELEKQLTTARIASVAFDAPTLRAGVNGGDGKAAYEGRATLEVKLAVYAQGKEAVAGK